MALLFSVPGLPWETQKPLEHLELFAGACSVTRGEWQDQDESQTNTSTTRGMVYLLNVAKKVVKWFIFWTSSKRLFFFESHPKGCEMVYLLTSFLQEGRHAIPLDLSFDEKSPGMNLLTNEGFSSALFHCATLTPGSSCTLAPVCSTFVAV